ncbi:dihydrofolate reductase [Allobranchiibius sp. GilTou38]|uniref:dihydrofolate reductase n=1 Tax=Allobranchiibius sp. GilTou38 TaxID=2815210 RepID=UPI001AA183E3|nr:dihydrofolate reductase [Allobranchiibius sp. GilTou38]MBO1768006.1 dihydrofolate reductase [Allobranchiibius sp. GilTou38]
MTITLIAAVARNGVIGRDGDMPWHVPGEQRGFKAATMGHPMLMGRKTFAAMGALPGRRSIVLTRDPDFRADGVEVARSLDEALLLTQDEDFFVVGGAQIYALALPYADRLLLSFIPQKPAGDAYFPGWPYDDSPAWRESAREDHDGWTVLTYDRVTPRTQVVHGPRIARGARQKIGASVAVMHEGRLLVTRREDNGLWCLPGGGVDAGETWSEAALREAREETGLEVAIDGVLAAYTDPNVVVAYPDGHHTQIFGVCFRAHPVAGEAGISEEVTETRWVTREEAAGLPLIPTARRLVPQAFDTGDVTYD